MAIDLWKAFAHLYPDAVLLVDYVLQDDGAGPYLAMWGLPGDPPTEGEITTAIADYDTAVAAVEAARAAKRTKQHGFAAGAVGQLPEDLTLAELGTLLALLLDLAGALDDDGYIRPLEEWS